MKLSVLLDNVTADGDGPVLNIQNNSHFENGIVQVDLGGGTATVTIKGRLSENMPWHDEIVYSANGADRITLFPQMKATVSGYASGTIRAEIVE